MLTWPSCIKIYVASQPCDMRNGPDGLAALVRQQGLNVFAGHLFVFLSKTCDRVKILYWERGGFVVWYKRLERGCFKMPNCEKEAPNVALDPSQLALLLEGLDLSKVRRPPRWQPPDVCAPP